MRRTVAIFLFLFSLFPVPALCGITNHLLQPDPGPNSRISNTTMIVIAVPVRYSVLM